MVADAKRMLQFSSRLVAYEIDKANQKTISIPQAMALAQESGLFGERSKSIDYAKRILAANPQLAGAYFAYEANADQEDAAYLANHPDEQAAMDATGRYLPCWRVKAGKLILSPLIAVESRSCYANCKNQYRLNHKNRTAIAEPYLYDGKIIVEQSCPITQAGSFVGIAGIGRGLCDIDAFWEGFRPYETSEFVLISKSGKVIASSMALGATTVSQEEGSTEEPLPSVGALTRPLPVHIDDTDYSATLRRFYGEKEDASTPIDRRSPLGEGGYYYMGTSIPTGEWTLVTRVAKAEILGPVHVILWRTVFFALLFLVFMLYYIWHFSRSVTRPIATLIGVSERIAKLDFDIALPEFALVELNTLKQSLLDMAMKLKESNDALESERGRLVASEENLRTTVDSIGDALIVTDPDGCVVRMNPVAETLTGWTSTEALAKPLSEVLQIISPEDRAPLPNPAIQVFSTGTIVTLTKYSEFVAKDNVTHQIEGSAAPIQNADGVLIGAVLVFRDLTEVHKNEHKLRSSEETFRALAENSPDILARFDRHYRYLYVNSTVKEVTSIPPAEFIGKTHQEMGFPEDFCSLWEEALRKVFTTGKSNRLEYTLPSGVSLDCLLAPELGVHGEVQAVMTSARDITSRKQTEMEAAHSKELLRTVLDIIPAHICAKNLEGRFVLVNKTLTDFYRTTVDAMTGVLHADVCEDEEELKSMLAADRKVIEGGHPVFIPEESMMNPDGSNSYLETYKIPFQVRGESVVLIVSLDISERKKLAEQLRESQKMEAVGQLAGGIAHDFNNLLQAINGYCDLLLMELDEGSVPYRFITEVARAGEKASVLVRQILGFSRRQTLDMKNVDLNNIVSDLTRMLGKVIGEHIDLQVYEGNEIGVVRADPGQIEQILMNLCVNARDAMPEGGTITIQTERTQLDEEYCKNHAWAEPGEYTILSVADTGCGMDEETQKKIFEPFFTTKDVDRGTGLGLSMVYGLVKQHKGFVEVHSVLGEGTIIKVYLPLLPTLATSVTNEIDTPVVGGAETILLAEDNEGVLGVAKAMLESAGYTIRTAADGEDALRVFDAYADEIALVLCDVMMPKLSGKAVYEQIIQKRPHIPFLFASGYNMNVIQTNFVLDDGMTLIQKPYHRVTLLRAVRRALDR